MDNKDDTALKILQKYDNDAKAIKFNEAMQKNDVATVMDLVNNQGVEPCGVYKKPDVSPDEVEFSFVLVPELQALLNDC